MKRPVWFERFVAPCFRRSPALVCQCGHAPIYHTMTGGCIRCLRQGGRSECPRFNPPPPFP